MYRIKKEKAAYFFITPLSFLVFVFVFLPLIQGIKLSFFEANLKQATWVGCKNYSEMFGDSFFWMELRNSFILVGLLVPSLIGFSFLIASLISKFGNVLQSFFRAAFYLPTVTSGIVMSIVWLWIFESTYGLLNYLLSLVRLGPVMWLGEMNPARLAIVIVVFSWLLGGNIILYIAALSAIPKTFYEASDIDGANWWQKLIYISVPLVMPMTLYLTIVSTIGGFQIWQAIYMLTGGGPAYATTNIAYHIFQLGFRYFRFGEASTHAVILLIIVFSIAFIQFKYLGEKLEF